MTELIKGKKYYCSDYFENAKGYREDKEEIYLYEFDGEYLRNKIDNESVSPSYWKYKLPADYSEETQQANARLIAAAPDLLEALEEALSHLEYCNYGDSWERSCAIDADLPKLIKSAIAKAKGEEKSNHV